MKQRVKKKWEKFLNWSLDFLLFIVPVLELSELITLIPPEYLPWYMLGAVLLRRFVRMLEERMESEDDETTTSTKNQ
jgi:hypothetical protein